MKKALFMSDGSDVAIACAHAVAARPIGVLAIVVGPNVSRTDADAILSCFKDAPPLIQTARPDLDPRIVAWGSAGDIDLALSIFFEFRVRPALLKAAKMGGITIHPSVLPNNGGFHTSFWGLVNKTPLGASLIWMDEGLDTGGVIAQKVFEDDGVMSAHEVRLRQRRMCAELFAEHIDDLIAGRIPPKSGAPCSYHFKRDIAAATTFGEDDVVPMSHLMRLGRATAHGDNGLLVRARSGERFHVKIAVSRLPPEPPAMA